jgi:hypothetical protein
MLLSAYDFVGLKIKRSAIYWSKVSRLKFKIFKSFAKAFAIQNLVFRAMRLKSDTLCIIGIKISFFRFPLHFLQHQV